ncbi:MAG: hypothetical protein Q9217_006450 [Psora testacea]
MSPLNKEIEAKRAEIQQISSTKKLSARQVMEVMLDLIDPSPSISPVEILRQYFERIKADERLIKINASDTTVSEIIKVFGLNSDITCEESLWTLAEDSILKEPTILRRHLKDLKEAFYQENSEATCRLTIDVILIQCRKYLRHKYNPPKAKATPSATPSTPPKCTFDALTEPAKEPVRFYPECTISVEIAHRTVPNKGFLVSGRADWALGYSSKDEDAALLVAMEAKQRSEFSAGESQLIAYLAILREKRRRASKTNIITQGFYSDGSRFAFVFIKDDGTIARSPTLDTASPEGLGMVFSFIVAMLETAMKSTPTVSPTKPGVLQDTEIHNFDHEVWSRIFKSMDESLMVSDDDTEDVIDLTLR